MQKTIVTGGCGFIGSAVVDVLLDQGHDVHIIDNLSLGKNHWVNTRPAPQLHVQDILDLNACAAIFERVAPQVVIHLAAHHYIPFCEQNPYQAYQLNVGGTVNVLELCKRSRVQKFFFASTGDVYPPSFAPHREVDMVSPIYTYGHSKLLGEQISIRYFETHLKDSSAVIGRIFNAAGPRETNPHLIPEVVKQIVAGKRIVEVGNMWPKRDFVDVHSMAEVIVNMTSNAAGVEVVNIGSGVVQEIGQVLSTLREAAPHPVEIISVAERQRPNDRPYLCPDTTRLKRLNGTAAKPFGIETARLLFQERGGET
jgi:UDP-glucose 4-epimerase